MPTYDVFLSHNSADKPAVEILARRLTDEVGLNPFLDKWHLIPGDPWQEAIEEALDQSHTCAVFIGPGGIGPWENEEMRAAIEQRVASRTFRVIPVLLPGAERGKRGRLPAFLNRATWVEFRHSLDDTEAFRRLVAGIKGQAPGRGLATVEAETICPYRGLQIFEAKHARFFFGREATTEWLVDELRQSHFLAVIGPSGSGKSSLVRAGLIPALRRGDLPNSDTWPLRVFRPGHRPLESLALAMTQLVGPTNDPTATLRLMEALAANQRQLHLTAQLALTDSPIDRNIFLVIDQFEEIFTLCRDEAQRSALIDNLLYASAIEGGRVVVILTMRADFYGKCAIYPDLAARITDHQMLVSPMVEDELRQAIERPAQLVGLEFEAGLVDTLLRDVQTEPGVLPLLQHTLLELWERREGRKLTFAAYREIGGLQGAIAYRAESLYATFDEAKKALTQRIMLRLTQPGEGTEDTRRRVWKGELLPTPNSKIRDSPAGGQKSAIANDDETVTVEKVLEQLVEARLVTISQDKAGQQDQVDVVHEALIRGWPRLQTWVDKNRNALQILHRLSDEAKRWDGQGRHESFLYRGVQLAEAEEMVKSHPEMLAPLDQAFLKAGVELRKANDRTNQRNRVWSMAGMGVFAGVLGNVIGVMTNLWIEGVPLAEFLPDILGGILVGGLIGFGCAAGIGLGLVYGAPQKWKAVAGGALGTVPAGILLGPPFMFPHPTILTAMGLGALVCGVYGAAVALSVILGHFLAGFNRLIVAALFGMLIGLPLGQFILEPLPLVLTTFGIAVGINLVEKGR